MGLERSAVCSLIATPLFRIASAPAPSLAAASSGVCTTTLPATAQLVANAVSGEKLVRRRDCCDGLLMKGSSWKPAAMGGCDGRLQAQCGHR